MLLSWSFKYIQMHFTISGSNLLVPIRFKPTYLHYCISLLRGLSISMLDWTQASQTVLSHQAEVKPQIYSAFPCQICNFKENGPKVPHSLASHCVSDFISPFSLAWLPSSLALTVSLTLQSAPGWAFESVLLLWNALSFTHACPPSSSFPDFVQMLYSQYGPAWPLYLMETTFPPLVIGYTSFLFFFFFSLKFTYAFCLLPVFPTSIEHSCLFCWSVYF